MGNVAGGVSGNCGCGDNGIKTKIHAAIGSYGSGSPDVVVPIACWTGTVDCIVTGVTCVGGNGKTGCGILVYALGSVGANGTASSRAGGDGIDGVICAWIINFGTADSVAAVKPPRHQHLATR